MIPKTEMHIVLDGIKLLGEYILYEKKRNPNTPLVVFKSDVAHAFRNIPCAPEWQMLQTVEIEDVCYVGQVFPESLMNLSKVTNHLIGK